MRTIQISDSVAYVEPDRERNITSSAGIKISSIPRIFIDTNMGINDSRAFLSRERPDMAVISHYHADHSSWGQTALEVCKSQVLVPEGEGDYLKSLHFYLEHSAAYEKLRPAWESISKSVAGYQEIEQFDYHHDGEILKSGSTIIRCLKSSGHSPSHTCFYFPTEKILYTADMGIGHTGPWYGAPDCSPKFFVESVLMLRGLDVRALLTSHDGTITSQIEQTWDRCLRRILAREGFIRKRLEEGKTKSDIVEAFVCFGGATSRNRTHFSDLAKMWHSVMFDHHLELLEEGGLRKIFPELNRYVGS
jgi:hydroxyacylglutathione hydrolase